MTSILPADCGIDPRRLPRVLTPEVFPPMALGSLESIYGFAGKDLSSKDMTGLPLDFMAEIAFDELTVWPSPEYLPAGFSPAAWMEEAESPALGIRGLHNGGITGKGVSVAVIDKPVLHTHTEFEGRMNYCPAENQPEDDHLHFHGASCASILAGRTCGVAPEAELFYFCVPDDGRNAHNYLLAMDKLLLVNRSLPDNRKIRLVSISDGFGPGNEDERLWKELVEKAKSAGVIVLYSNRLRESDFVWGGSLPYLDGDDAANYRLARHLAGKVDPADVVLIPADYRTTAANSGGYVYWGQGGFSWAIAYAAGLFALALSIEPNLGCVEIVESLAASKSPCGGGGFVVNPAKFIERIGSR